MQLLKLMLPYVKQRMEKECVAYSFNYPLVINGVLIDWLVMYCEFCSNKYRYAVLCVMVS